MVARASGLGVRVRPQRVDLVDQPDVRCVTLEDLVEKGTARPQERHWKSDHTTI
jgi:hypothetical protein